MIEIGIPTLLGALAWTFVVYRLGVFVGRNSDERPGLSGPPVPPRPLPPEVRAQVTSALAARQKIEAIRLVREATGIGLKDAKLYVEAMERE